MCPNWLSMAFVLPSPPIDHLSVPIPETLDPVHAFWGVLPKKFAVLVVLRNLRTVKVYYLVRIEYWRLSLLPWYLACPATGSGIGFRLIDSVL